MMTAKTLPRKSRYINLFLTGIFLINSGLGVIYIISCFSAIKQDLYWRADFSMFYTGGTMIRESQGSRLYDYDLQTETQQRILNGRSFANGLLPFDYPPHVAILFSPLSIFPLKSAYFIWSVIQVGLLLWMIYLLIIIMKDWAYRERLLGISAAIAFPPLFLNFLLGTVSLLMLVSVLQIYITLKYNQTIKTAIWILVGTIKPTVIVLPVFALLAGRRWSVLFWAACGGLTIFFWTSFSYGFHTWRILFEQLGTIIKYFDVYGFHPSVMHNFRGTLTVILGAERADLINTMSSAAFLASILFTIWIWSGKWNTENPDFELRMALTILLIPLFSLHTYSHDNLVLVAAFILFYGYLQRQGHGRALFAALSLSYPILYLISEYGLGERLLFRLSLLVTLFLISWAVKLLLADHQHSPLATL
jgi:hypothetical protein